MISKKLRIKWNFELTVFELTVPTCICFSIMYALCKLHEKAQINYLASLALETSRPPKFPNPSLSRETSSSAECSLSLETSLSLESF